MKGVAFRTTAFGEYGNRRNDRRFYVMKELFLFLFFLGVAWLIWRTMAKTSTSSSNKPAKCDPPLDEDMQTRHLRHTLQFAKEQHRVFSKQQSEMDSWQRRFGAAKVAELDQLSGLDFEEFLAGLFRGQGYATELTPSSGDYGADLILSKNGIRIAVQAKRYVGSVGVQAVQEALSGQVFYQCDTAWVVTTGSFTANALTLAKKSGVKMIGRSDIGQLMA
jgi:HJR/Mrr/RecB family endonuclease